MFHNKHFRQPTWRSSSKNHRTTQVWAAWRFPAIKGCRWQNRDAGVQYCWPWKDRRLDAAEILHRNTSSQFNGIIIYYEFIASSNSQAPPSCYKHVTVTLKIGRSLGMRLNKLYYVCGERFKVLAVLSRVQTILLYTRYNLRGRISLITHWLELWSVTSGGELVFLAFLCTTFFTPFSWVYWQLLL